MFLSSTGNIICALGKATLCLLKNVHKECYNSRTNGWIISKFLSWVKDNMTLYPGFGFDQLFKVAEVKVRLDPLAGHVL
jgi:hypothetical protein